MYTSIINQFLSLSVFLDNVYNYTTKKLCIIFDNVIIYTVIHDLTDPFTKTYSCIFIPFLYFTVNHAIFEYTLNTKYVCNNDFSFYENMIVFNGQLIYVVSNKPLKKITSDFKKLEYLSISVDTCIQQKCTICYTTSN